MTARQPDLTPDPRRVPIIVVASARGHTADDLAQRLRHDGAIALAAHSVEGCLRVATSVGPDVVLLDRGLPPRLEKLLRAHPISARARLLHLSDQPAVVGDLQRDLRDRLHHDRAARGHAA